MVGLLLLPGGECSIEEVFAAETLLPPDLDPGVFVGEEGDACFPECRRQQGIDIGERTISLPLWPRMTDAHVDGAVAALESTLASLR